MIKTRIASFGSYVPSKVVTNKDLEKMMDTSDEWIQQRSGITERRWIEPGKDTMKSMALAASQQALQRAGWTADDVDCIIFSSLLSDYVFPGTGVLVQHGLGGKRNIPAYDIRNGCSGFLYGLQMANSFIRSGVYKKVLLSAAEIHSTSIKHSPEGRDVGVLFGDGASTCLLEATEKDEGIIDVNIYSQGEHAGKLAVLGPSPNDQPRISETTLQDKRTFPVMDGKFVFKNAVERMCESMGEICKKNKVDPQTIDFVVPHQANMRINQSVMQHLGIPESKTHPTIDHYGNTTSATIPITFDEAVQKKKIKRGDLVALTAFGAGFTWGSALVRY
jgi:3-oxoacyl-[acyl-carrier-protein] synthase III